jgi:CheY-like chemotaxis protein/anti-sigma regulatory factor (Ser/Thr protein kinase)
MFYVCIKERCTVSTALYQVDGEAVGADLLMPGELTKVLVIDDSAFDRHLVGRLLGSMGGVRVLFAANVREGLAVIEREAPDIVLTDLIMPEIDGLALVLQVRALYPEISVILMTAHGSEDVAMEALRAGAANYIPKKHLVRDLAQTLRKILAIASFRRERRRILRCLVRRESTLILDSDPELIIPLVTLLNEELEGVGNWDGTALMQVCIALQEALTNALYHGNLELSSELRQDNEKIYHARATERQHDEPYRSRRIRVHAQIDRDSARFLICDDGPGFDTAILNRPIQSDDLERIGGRGLLLIRTFMDQVSFNESGNQIRMVKLGGRACRKLAVGEPVAAPRQEAG